MLLGCRVVFGRRDVLDDDGRLERRRGNDCRRVLAKHVGRPERETEDVPAVEEIDVECIRAANLDRRRRTTGRCRAVRIVEPVVRRQSRER